jgi:hypothetical protein
LPHLMSLLLSHTLPHPPPSLPPLRIPARICKRKWVNINVNNQQDQRNWKRYMHILFVIMFVNSSYSVMFYVFISLKASLHCIGHGDGICLLE